MAQKKRAPNRPCLSAKSLAYVLSLALKELCLKLRTKSPPIFGSEVSEVSLFFLASGMSGLKIRSEARPQAENPGAHEGVVFMRGSF